MYRADYEADDGLEDAIFELLGDAGAVVANPLGIPLVRRAVRVVRAHVDDLVEGGITEPRHAVASPWTLRTAGDEEG